MKSLTLTPQDLEQFVEAARHALDRFRFQYALMLPKFPTVTPEALEAMKAAIAKDPQGIGHTPGIDGAVYFAALFEIGARNQDDGINALAQGATDADTLLSLFQRATACANTINALLLLSRGGLMSELHFDEAQSDARRKVATDAASKRHAPKNAARDWVVSQWTAKRQDYRNNKSAFARDYERLVSQKFPGVKVTQKTIKDVWLP